MTRQEPLVSLEQLANWTEANRPDCHVANLMPRSPRDQNSPKVLVCHDMHGGYLDDAFTFGNSNDSAYRLFHFHVIDQFVYFSHNLVTIPPIGWIDCCHRNGVECLGVFIAEWEAGAAAMRQLLESRTTAELFAKQLTRLAVAHKFDGWLLNIECSIEPDSVPVLLHFVQRLRELANQQSQSIVWYDSVCCDGSLSWKNSVCEANLQFALAAGAIFLNYCWTPQLLQDTVQFLEAQGVDAGDLDVLVGIDCFGRGCPGGGGFNCDAALRLIRPHVPQLGVAIFAPAWVFEFVPSEQQQSWDTLTERNVEFWNRIQPLLGQPRAWTQRLNTALCLGQGSLRFDRGRVVSSSRWNNLRDQHLMPHFWDSGCDHHHLAVCRSRGFQYGGCLCYSISGASQSQEFPLFNFNIPADRVKAFKLVYSLDDAFEDRPLDPVTVCLVAKYTNGVARDAYSSRVVAICHRDSSRLDSFELAAANSHFASERPQRTVAFTRTAQRDLEADFGVVWHELFTYAAHPVQPQRQLHDSAGDEHQLDESRDQLQEEEGEEHEEVSAECEDWRLCQLGLFFLLPSRLQLTAPVNIYVGQIKVSVHKD